MPRHLSKQSGFSETPKRARSRWDETPDISAMAGGAVAGFYGETPAGDMGMVTPTPGQIQSAGMMTPMSASLAGAGHKSWMPGIGP